jgi:hypothetical protein
VASEAADAASQWSARDLKRAASRMDSVLGVKAASGGA